MKDADYCGETNKSETNIANMSLLMSVMISDCVKKVKNMETFINSKHIKKDLKRKYVHGDKHIARTLDYVE